MPERPLAYLITWTCYGTWLHGDRRGSVDREHNVAGTPYLDPDPVRWSRVRQSRLGPAVTLNRAARTIVAATIREHAERRGWSVLAASVRSNHVHVVIAAGGVSPEAMMGQIKAWCARRLRERGLAGAGTPWTRHGSTRYLWDEERVAEAVRYVQEGQDVPR